MTRDYEDDLDETARLILMEDSDCSIKDFAERMRQVHGSSVGIAELGRLSSRYRGKWATHDPATGERLPLWGAR